MEWGGAQHPPPPGLWVQVYCPIDKMHSGGKLGPVRYVGVLVGYAENIPSYRVWNPLKAKKVANVGGAEFDESVVKA